jgi:hypothetical protein
LTTYRIVFFDSRGRASALDDFDVPNDEAALTVGAERRGVQPAIEIWHFERMIGRFDSDRAPSAAHRL